MTDYRFVAADAEGNRFVLPEPTVEDLQNGSGGGGNTVTINTSTCNVGDAVYIRSANTASPAYQDGSINGAEHRCIGFVTDTNEVTTQGEIENASWSLTPGDRYFLNNSPGEITNTPSSTGWLVPVGIAKTTTTLIIELKSSIYQGA